MLELVRQHSDKPGCGAACLAMLAGETYSYGKRRFPDGDEERTNWAEMRRALSKAGIVLGRARWTGRLAVSHQRKDNVEFALRDRLTANALLKVNEDGDGDWHWVVWDHDKKRLLDPLDTSVKRANRKYKVESYAYADRA